MLLVPVHANSQLPRWLHQGRVGDCLSMLLTLNWGAEAELEWHIPDLIQLNPDTSGFPPSCPLYCLRIADCLWGCVGIFGYRPDWWQSFCLHQTDGHLQKVWGYDELGTSHVRLRRQGWGLASTTPVMPDQFQDAGWLVLWLVLRGSA